jgi:hypothetical protein
LSICSFSFGHCVVCSSSIYRFVLALWYLQSLLNEDYSRNTFASFSLSASSNTTLFVVERFCFNAQHIQIVYVYILGHCNAISFLSVVCGPMPNIFSLCTNLILFEGYTYASGCSGVSRTKTRPLKHWHQLSNKSYYLIFSTFLFELKMVSRIIRYCITTLW